MPIDNLKDMFFAECEELLEQLSEGLEAMEAGEADAETVNAVFRAVHSIKGTAGAFGFAHLVGFTHHFETVLDLIRSEQLTAELDTMRLMLRSSDVLSDLVEYARSRPDEQPAYMEATKAALVAICDEAGAATAEPPSIAKQSATDAAEAAVFEPVAFEPSALDTLAGLELPQGRARYEVTFTPEDKFFSSGHDFERLLSELGKLGDFTCLADTSKFPHLENFDPAMCYLTWVFEIETEATAAEVLARTEERSVWKEFRYKW